LTWKKPTIEYIRSKFSEEEYILHSEEYKNSRSNLKYTCPNGHVYFISWTSWTMGHRCGLCANNIKLTIDFVKERFSREGYALLSNNYCNAHTKLDYVCPIGHISSIDWAHWKKGKRCLICSVIKNTGSGHYNWQGGVSYEPYCPIWKDKEYLKDIKSRDNNKCLNPSCISKNPNDLTVHHIDYNKKNCDPANLITICRSCNATANYDRDWHLSWYKAIMFKRYNFT
jgi:hypothetical protein